MTTSSLPSTLVKCLYLFFDLPDPESVEAENSVPKPLPPTSDIEDNAKDPPVAANTTTPAEICEHTPDEKEPSEVITEDQCAETSLEMTTMDRRLLLQKVFVQVISLVYYV